MEQCFLQVLMIRKTNPALTKTYFFVWKKCNLFQVNIFNRFIRFCSSDTTAWYNKIKVKKQSSQPTHNLECLTCYKKIPDCMDFSVWNALKSKFLADIQFVHSYVWLACWILIYVVQIVSITYIQCKKIDGVEKLQFVVGAFK